MDITREGDYGGRDKSFLNFPGDVRYGDMHVGSCAVASVDSGMIRYPPHLNHVPVLGYGGISAQYQDQRVFDPDMDKKFNAQFTKKEPKKFRIPVISWLIEHWNTVKKI